MRLVIDLQFCQNANTTLTHDTLALAQDMVRSAGQHDVWVVFSNRFPARLETLLAAFRQLASPVTVRVYDTPAPDGSLRVQRMIELIRDNFLQALGADLVFAPHMFAHAVDTVGAIGTQRRGFVTAVSVADVATLDSAPGATPAQLDAHARQKASLQCADIVLVANVQAGADIGARIGATRQPLVVPVNDTDEAARQLWQLFETALVERAAAPAPEEKPRLAYVSPLPPQQSGIADYSAELLAVLEADYDIDLIVDAPEQVSGALAAMFPIHGPAWLQANARQFERVLYHFGNSDAHQYMFPLLRAVPGIVVLHDFFLSNVIDNMEYHAHVPEAFFKALFYSHGYQGLLEHKVAGRNPTLWKFPLNKEVLDLATGVIVHSPYPRQLADRWYGEHYATRWRTVPLLRSAVAAADARPQARAGLGLADDVFLICSFGMVGSSKLNDRLLAAFCALPPDQRTGARLVYVGADDPSAYGIAFHAAVAASGASAQVHVTGFIDADQYRQYLDAADVAVQLRGLSRGETSASILDCLLHGLPTIINANGANASLPDDVLVKLPDQFQQGELDEALALLQRDGAARRRLADAARAHVARCHAPAQVGPLYVDAIETFARHSPHAHYRTLLREFNDIGAPVDARHHELIAAAKAIAANQPVNATRQMLVDISAVVQSDLKTGIQRVVRSILLALISAPPPGFRVEPVYGDGGNRRYRYARKFTCAMLGLAQPEMEDAPIEHRPGDIFLGLDLSANSTAQNQSLLHDMRHHGIPVYFVVYDILPMLQPDSFPYGTAMYFREYIETISGIADGLLCISRAVADELGDWLGAHAAARALPLSISYFHLGADIHASAPSFGLPANAADILAAVQARPTILMVGTIEPRKGHAQALAAFDLLWSQKTEVNLVIVGKEGWMVDALVKQLQRHPQAGKKLFWLPGVSDEMLMKLYDAASALLAASIGEGFGLPLIEAAQHGLPIIARDLPVFREVSGEHAFYFSGNHPDDLARALQQWLQLFTQGQAPASLGMPWLSWNDSAAQLLDAVLGPNCYRTVPSAP